MTYRKQQVQARESAVKYFHALLSRGYNYDDACVEAHNYQRWVLAVARLQNTEENEGC